MNLDIYPFIGIDIGGTLAKICFSIAKDTPTITLEKFKVSKY